MMRSSSAFPARISLAARSIVCPVLRQLCRLAGSSREKEDGASISHSPLRPLVHSNTYPRLLHVSVLIPETRCYSTLALYPLLRVYSLIVSHRTIAHLVTYHNSHVQSDLVS